MKVFLVLLSAFLLYVVNGKTTKEDADLAYPRDAHRTVSYGAIRTKREKKLRDVRNNHLMVMLPKRNPKRWNGTTVVAGLAQTAVRCLTCFLVLCTLH